MSYTETHTGEIKIFQQPFGDTYLEWAKEIIKQHNDKFESKWYKDEIEQVLCDYFDEYPNLIRVNDTIYEMHDNKLPDEDLCILKGKEDGTFKYFTRFHNGGICLHEIITDKLKDYYGTKTSS